jgi:hypothetical protein
MLGLSFLQAFNDHFFLETKAKFDELLSVHVYSLQKEIPKVQNNSFPCGYYVVHDLRKDSALIAAPEQQIRKNLIEAPQKMQESTFHDAK